MVKIAHLLDLAWADFALDNPVAVARAVVALREHLATLPEDGHLHGPTADLVDALESNPATAHAAWEGWMAAESSKVRRKLSDTQAARRTLKKKPTIEDIQKTMYGLTYGSATKEKVAARLCAVMEIKVSVSTLDRVLHDAGTSWAKIKTSHPGKR
ncbi:hypothetical protein F3K02_16930 [Hydrogenophaga sp. D2P1]|uniref:Uncharacterized protein n=1 Tax=Hydrogenophaga aromaticivorans TaxID=2610898 RepID=A0A7Y8GZQ7_9BURK|nr:hypothetical protein [Hydrogenophaga aromaticivorans]NWF46923.1 hypothetical protein [Hydrogenophaga aromaticivorans]